MVPVRDLMSSSGAGNIHGGGGAHLRVLMAAARGSWPHRSTAAAVPAIGRSGTGGGKKIAPSASIPAGTRPLLAGGMVTATGRKRGDISGAGGSSNSATAAETSCGKCRPAPDCGSLRGASSYAVTDATVIQPAMQWQGGGPAAAAEVMGNSNQTGRNARSRKQGEGPGSRGGSHQRDPGRANSGTGGDGPTGGSKRVCSVPAVLGVVVNREAGPPAQHQQLGSAPAFIHAVNASLEPGAAALAQVRKLLVGDFTAAISKIRPSSMDQGMMAL